MAARKILDIGCGTDLLKGAVGMDRNPRSRAKVIHDVEDRPWPFPDSTFDHVRAKNILEHVDDFVGVMEEIHRVAKPNATVETIMPFMSSLDFATDPTHRRAAAWRTFDYFDPSTDLGDYDYTTAHFEVIEAHYLRVYIGRVARVFERIDRYMIPLLERHTTAYERFFAYLYPMHAMQHLLRVIKE